MPRWRQEIQADGTSKFVPIDDAARKQSGHFVQGDIEPFRSPVDGTVISDRKQLREHNERNGVVSADEFSNDFYARKAKERADFYQGRHSRDEAHKRKQEIYNAMVKAEREAGW